MPRKQVNVVVGQTAPVKQQLLEDGVAVSLSDKTVALELEDAEGTAVTTAGKVTVYDATNGKVQFNPAATDFDATKGPYKARWIVTDADNKTAPFPDVAHDEWIVHAR